MSSKLFKYSIKKVVKLICFVGIVHSQICSLNTRKRHKGCTQRLGIACRRDNSTVSTGNRSQINALLLMFTCNCSLAFQRAGTDAKQHYYC